mgnify:CR=1 FL=1
MPQTVNGIGTMYYGSSNKEERFGVCESCHHEGLLRNYETKLWITIFYIPIIPLGRKQILDECSNCGRHYALSPEEWQQSQLTAVKESAEQMAAKPDDPESMVSMHATLVACNRNDEASELLNMLDTRFADDVDVQMYLGACCERQGNEARANEHFRRALELEPDNPSPRRAVGMELLSQGKLNEARELFSALEPPGEHYDPLVWFMLASAYQEQGRHEDALKTFQLTLSATPEIAQDKAFRQAVRFSEAALGKETSCVPKERFFRSAKFLVPAAAAAVVAALIGINVYISNHRTVHVVNGLPVRIEVTLDETIKLPVPAGTYRAIALPEGPHQAHVTQPTGLIDPVDFTLESGWFGRFFKKPAFVLDPSRSSVVLWEQTVYSAVPILEDDEDEDFRVHIGQTLTYYDDVDFRFKRFPRSIEVKESRRSIRTRVSLYRGSLTDVLGAYGDDLEHGEKLGLLERHLLVAPDDTALLTAYVYLAEEADAEQRLRAFLAAGLDSRPLRVQWHRTYQSMLMSKNRTNELVKRYDGYLEKEPNNSQLLYLRGRLEPTVDKTAAYFERAIEADEANWFAWFGKAFGQMARADFDGALRSYDRALQLSPQEEQVAERRREAQLALGDYAAIESALTEHLKKQTFDLPAHLDLLATHLAAGEEEKARQAHQRLMAEVDKANLAFAQRYRSLSSMILEYGTQDFEAWRAQAQEVDLPELTVLFTFGAELEMGNPQAAQETLEASDVEANAYQALELAIAWRQKGDREAAQQWLATAIERLRGADPSSQFAATLLSRSAERPITLAEALDIDIDPEQKRVIVLALAENAADREAMLDLAEKLNFAREFPHHFVRRHIEAMRN